MMMAGEADDDDDDDDDDATAATCPVGTDGSLPTPLRTEEGTPAVEVVERPSSPHHRHRCHLRDNWNKNDRRDSWIGRDVMSRCSDTSPSALFSCTRRSRRPGTETETCSGRRRSLPRRKALGSRRSAGWSDVGIGDSRCRGRTTVVSILEMLIRTS